MRSLSADAALQHGLNPYANIIDELHAHRTADLYTALTTGTGAREQPFTLWISTAGVDAPGILVELHASMFDGPGELEDRGSLLVYRDRANGVLIWWYGAPRDADIEDPAVWLAANPASWLRDGRYLSQEYARLRARGALLDWRRYHLNQFVGHRGSLAARGRLDRAAASVTRTPPTRSTGSTQPSRSASASTRARRATSRRSSSPSARGSGSW